MSRPEYINDTLDEITNDPYYDPADVNDLCAYTDYTEHEIIRLKKIILQLLDGYEPSCRYCNYYYVEWTEPCEPCNMCYHSAKNYTYDKDGFECVVSSKELLEWKEEIEER